MKKINNGKNSSFKIKKSCDYNGNNNNNNDDSSNKGDFDNKIIIVRRRRMKRMTRSNSFENFTPKSIDKN